MAQAKKSGVKCNACAHNAHATPRLTFVYLCCFRHIAYSDERKENNCPYGC